MGRPEITEMPLAEAMAAMTGGGPGLYITMSPGQWDALLQGAYDHGWILLELDKNEIPVRAYRRKLEA